MEADQSTLNSLQEQLLFELLKAIDKIKEGNELEGSSYNSVIQVDRKNGLDELINRISSIVDRLDVVENEIMSILNALDCLRRKLDMIYYGLKVLHKDCVISHEF
ncbi:MAG: hypothetical protein GSR79_05245 [Desulfurococcales archaeon]|nr:hypothetical protein [Desulfurococcales archaeon]